MQYEYAKAPVDHGKGFSGRLLRIFERGHRTEDMVIRWLRSVFAGSLFAIASTVSNLFRSIFLERMLAPGGQQSAT